MTTELYTSKLRAAVSEKVDMQALGNSDRDMKTVAIDLIHASKISYKDIAYGAFLCEATVKKLATEKTRWPRADTIERIYRYFGVQLTGELVAMKHQYSNKAKK